jgi:hypothetical protein
MYLSPRSRLATYRLLAVAALLLMVVVLVDLVRGDGVEWVSLAVAGALLAVLVGHRLPRSRS